MSTPKITVKFRTKEKIPFSIETLRGKIYRCGVCGKVFYSRDEFEQHLPAEKNKDYSKLQFPELDKNISISVIYSQDIRDLTNPKFPKLRKGDKLFKKKDH